MTTPNKNQALAHTAAVAVDEAIGLKFPQINRELLYASPVSVEMLCAIGLASQIEYAAGALVIDWPDNVKGLPSGVDALVRRYLGHIQAALTNACPICGTALYRQKFACVIYYCGFNAAHYYIEVRA